MEKVDFAKIEEALASSREDAAEKFRDDPSKKLESIVKKRANILIFLKLWIKRIPKEEENKPFIKRIRDLETNYTEQEWVKLESLKDQILAQLNTGIKTAPTDEELINLEKHAKKKSDSTSPNAGSPSTRILHFNFLMGF